MELIVDDAVTITMAAGAGPTGATGPAGPTGATGPAGCMLVRDGRIAAVGSADEVRAVVSPGAQVVRLDGATVVPGLIDAHCHVSNVGYLAAGADCSQPSAPDIPAIQARLRSLGFYNGAVDGVWGEGTQAAIERSGGDAQALERRLTLFRQLQHMNAAVVRVTLTGDEAVRLHRVQVVGDGSAFDTDGVGQLALTAHRSPLERYHDQPHRSRPTRRCQRVVERAVHSLGGRRELEADGSNARRSRHGGARRSQYFTSND